MFGNRKLRRMQNELASANMDVEYYKEANAKLIKENIDLRVELLKYKPETKEAMQIKHNCTCKDFSIHKPMTI